MDEKIMEQVAQEAKTKLHQEIWDMYVKFIAQIVVDYKILPTPVYKEFFNEATLTKYAEIVLMDATEKDIEISRGIIDKKQETI